MSQPSSSCCPWMKGFGGFLMAAVIAGGGFWLGQRGSGDGFVLPPELINATATSSGEQFSLATGTVSSDGEGLFVLDHETGDLACYIMYPRTAKFGGVYKTNVKATLAGSGGAKGAKYLMVTGAASFAGGRGNAGPAGTVLYVLDATSGNFVAYGLTFSRTMQTSGQPQSGEMRVLDVGSARQMAIRDN